MEEQQIGTQEFSDTHFSSYYQRFAFLLAPWFRHGGVFVGLFTSCPAGNSGRCKCLPGGRELQNLGRTNRVILTHPSIMCRMKCCQSSCFILLNKVHRTGFFLGTVQSSCCILLRPRERRLRTLHRCQALPAAAWRRRTDLHLLMPVVWKLCRRCPLVYRQPR